MVSQRSWRTELVKRVVAVREREREKEMHDKHAEFEFIYASDGQDSNDLQNRQFNQTVRSSLTKKSQYDSYYTN